MHLEDYGKHAAAALEAPDQVRPLLENIRYADRDQEWYVACQDTVLASFPLDIKLWVHRLLSWLQHHYPYGPQQAAAPCRGTA